jgi:ketosteroid isomerase-like protein
MQLVKEATDAYNRGGIEAALEYYDPNVEFITASEGIDDRVYRGHDGMREHYSLWREHFDDFHLDRERILDVDDSRVLVLGHQRGRIKGSDQKLQHEIAFAGEIRDGKVERVRIYLSWDEALKAVGLE